MRGHTRGHTLCVVWRGDTAHCLMVTFRESEEAIRVFAGDDISRAKYYDFDKYFLLELEPCSTRYEMFDKLRQLSPTLERGRSKAA
jgi:hypothetical protein